MAGPRDPLIAATLVALSALLLSETVAETWALGGYIDEAVLVGLLVVGMGSAILRRRVPLGAVLLTPAAFALWVGFTTWGHGVPLSISVPGATLLLKPAIIFATFYLLPFRAGEPAARAVLSWFAVAGIAVIGFAVALELPFGTNPLPGINTADRLGLRPLRSLFVHPGPAAHVAFLFVVVFLVDWLVRRRRWRAVLAVAAAFLLVATLRAKALLLLPPVAALMIYLTLQRARPLRLRRVVLGSLLVLVTVGAVFLAADTYSDRLQHYFGEDSTAIRTILLRGAVDLNVRSYGLGVGAGMYGSATSVDVHYSPYYRDYGLHTMWGARPDHPAFITDQWWAWYLAEAGIIGALIFLAFLLMLVHHLDRIAVRVRGTNPALSVLALSGVGALTYGVLSGYAAGTLNGAPQGYLIMALAGLTFSVTRAEAGRHRKEQE